MLWREDAAARSPSCKRACATPGRAGQLPLGFPSASGWTNSALWRLCWATAEETLPSRTLGSPVLPREPVAITPAPISSAMVTISCHGVARTPTRASAANPASRSLDRAWSHPRARRRQSGRPARGPRTTPRRPTPSSVPPQRSPPSPASIRRRRSALDAALDLWRAPSHNVNDSVGTWRSMPIAIPSVDDLRPSPRQTPSRASISRSAIAARNRCCPSDTARWLPPRSTLSPVHAQRLLAVTVTVSVALAADRRRRNSVSGPSRQSP